MTAPVLAPEDVDTDEPDLVHLVCECDENRALCGTELGDQGWVTGSVPPERRCVVCWDLIGCPCDRCGSTWT